MIKYSTSYKISVCFRQIPLYLNEKELFLSGQVPTYTYPPC